MKQLYCFESSVALSTSISVSSKSVDLRNEMTGFINSFVFVNVTSSLMNLLLCMSKTKFLFKPGIKVSNHYEQNIEFPCSVVDIQILNINILE